jgi:hypothetical protein
VYKEWVEEAGTSLTLLGFPEFAGRLRSGFADSSYPGALHQLALIFEQMNARKKVISLVFLHRPTRL